MKQYEVVAAIIIHQGKVLCMQKGQTRYAYTCYKWEFPGGKIEAGESHQEALRREIQEELDMEICVGEHVITINHTYPDFAITMHCYFCSVHAPKLTLHEHQDFRWLDFSELNSLDWAAADIPASEFLYNTSLNQ